MLEIRENENESSKGGKYAWTEEELYEKAIALLEKCKIEVRRPVQKVPESTADDRATPAGSANGEKSVTGRGAGRRGPPGRAGGAWGRQETSIRPTL
jgi:hypothetical protein